MGWKAGGEINKSKARRLMTFIKQETNKAFIGFCKFCKTVLIEKCECSHL